MGSIHGEETFRATILATDTEVVALLSLFQAVADELGWQPGEFLARRPERSLHFAAFKSGVMAGGLQLVLPDSLATFPYKAVWPEVELANVEHLAHVTILALSPEFRGGPALFWPLCIELWRYSVLNHIEGIVMEATPPMLQIYRRMGWPLEVVGELRTHWGEECYLCFMGTLQFAGSLVVKARRSTKYGELVAMLLQPQPEPICVAA